jgi:hypothetical protein
MSEGSLRASAILRPVHLAYQPPASSTFLSQQISHQQPASSTFLSEQTSTSHQPPAKRTGFSVLSFLLCTEINKSKSQLSSPMEKALPLCWRTYVYNIHQ